MSITSIDISALYITMFNRVPEGAGHKFWFNLAKKQGLNTSQVAQQMLNSAPAQEYFAGKNSNEDGAMLELPLKKSRVNNRLRKITQIAEEISDNKGY